MPDSHRSSIHDPRYVAIVARIRAARLQQRLSQAQLGALIGRDQAFTSKVERCERRLDLLEVMILCRVLRLPLRALVPDEFADIVDG